jgi:nucleoside-diphosphate-sugar epimerase
MRVVLIGGSGHIGTYLVPMLIERDYEVINITRCRHCENARRLCGQLSAAQQGKDCC